MKLMWIVIVFLVIGGFIIAKSNDLDLEEGDDRKTFLKTFGGWIVDTGKNVKGVTSYAVKEYDWLPEDNETNLSGDIDVEET
ncbi:hypothetical protein HQ529_06175 [Candidatus Woesearchaeota archaeon]|nr:hypothetical protein [Candidatus Woesearchaeota archaeon]